MSRKSLWLFLILALIAAGLSIQPAAEAQKQKQQKYAASSGPPTLALNVEPNVIKSCEGGAQAQLVANAKSPDGYEDSRHSSAGLFGSRVRSERSARNAKSQRRPCREQAF